MHGSRPPLARLGHVNMASSPCARRRCAIADCAAGIFYQFVRGISQDLRRGPKSTSSAGRPSQTSCGGVDKRLGGRPLGRFDCGAAARRRRSRARRALVLHFSEMAQARRARHARCCACARRLVAAGPCTYEVCCVSGLIFNSYGRWQALYAVRKLAPVRY